MTQGPSRRQILGAATATGLLSGMHHGRSAFAAETHAGRSSAESSNDPTSRASISMPKISLNTSTIRGHQLSVPEQIRVTADAGYDAIEPWIKDLRGFVDSGGKLSDLKRQLDDSGIGIAGAIGFAKWIVNDAQERQAGLDEARRDMEMVRELGGVVMAAPPIGAHNETALRDSGPIELEVIAERYRALLEIGDEVGVTPLLELWGFSPTLSRLGELAYVSTAAAHPSAAVLPDFYHIYKGGNSMTSLAMIEASRMPLFHINDYPDQPPPATIADKDRVFPGDGVCPLVDTITMLLNNGFAGTFSLELFNPEYWKRPVGEVTQEGFTKSKAVIEQAVVKATANSRS
ncbi:sugar phosphate isomerase/epimerase family protein [Aporhodopirellula aestuarii]|uniref:Sugar phosphate isomerase/epimerase n=1 Tax=Aporhodopirellula aestuarii TaxID=2950107 RepID=A0ABT0U3N7_9BACT|nr:sugar phosphate isomerase/epimerase family protein [Aporhodopirellula aestuarii]MCM2371525.1 sugar phosphate isomerase/epimerase [Aporhodopirellula aestuarii]